MKKEITEIATIPNETELLPDLASFDWGEGKFTKREKLFCFWYVHPATYGNAAFAARKAGYSEKHAARLAVGLLNRERIRSAIARLNETIRKGAIDEAYNKIVQKLINRATVDRASLFNFETAISEKGQEYLKITPKKPDELAQEQRDLIEAIEFSGVYGIANYKLYSSEKAEREIMRLYERLHGLEKDAGYDSEAVVEVIKGDLQARVTLMQKNSEIAAIANLRDVTNEARAEED